MPQKIAILDYNAGNLSSVSKRIDQLKAQPVICRQPADLPLCDKVILPGVGHFASAVKQLQADDWREALEEFAQVKQKPMLGICLGLQLMGLSSEEAPGYAGLGWLNTSVVRFNHADNHRFRTPHTGWNTIISTGYNQLLSGLSATSEFYFTHAYHLHRVDAPFVSAQTRYEYAFAAAVQQANLFGVQFHPEKSHAAGETVLKNFLLL